MKNKLFSVCLSIAFISCGLHQAPAFGEGTTSSSQYSLGDQIFSVNAGAFIPLFLLGGSPQVGGLNLSVGGVITIDWAAYLSGRWRIGASLGWDFAFDPNYTLFMMVPIIGKISYLIDFYPWEIPLTFGAGMNVIKYSFDSTIDLLIKPGAGLLWSYNSSWQFGLNLNYWWDMQFTNASSTGLGFVGANFLEVSLVAIYHF